MWLYASLPEMWQSALGMQSRPWASALLTGLLWLCRFVNRAARYGISAAHGGQICTSAEVIQAILKTWAPDVSALQSSWWSCFYAAIVLSSPQTSVAYVASCLQVNLSLPSQLLAEPIQIRAQYLRHLMHRQRIIRNMLAMPA